MKEALPADINDNVKQQAELILSAGEQLSISLPDNTEELKAWLVDKENQLARETAKQGFGFLALRSQIAEGEFTSWLEKHDFKRQRVYESMNIANMLLSAPEDSRPKLLGMGKSKLIEIARLPEESIEDMAESGKLDELATKSSRELRDEVKRLRAKLAQAETETDTAKQKQKKLEAALDVRRETNQVPDFYAIVREESRALTQQADLCIDDLSALFHEELQRLGSSELGDEARHYSERGMDTLTAHVAGLAARISKLARDMEKQVDISAYQSELIYNDEEIALAAERHAVICNEHKLQAQVRADDREAKKKRSRGRPAKRGADK